MNLLSPSPRDSTHFSIMVVLPQKRPPKKRDQTELWIATALTVLVLGVAALMVYRSPYLGVVTAGSLAMYGLYWWGHSAKRPSPPPPRPLLRTVEKSIASAAKAVGRASVSVPVDPNAAGHPAKPGPAAPSTTPPGGAKAA